MAARVRLDGSLIRRFGPATVATVVLVLVSMAYVDRPLATWVHATFRSQRYYDWARDFYLALLGAGVIIGLIGIAAAIRWLNTRTRDRSTLVVASWAAIAGLVASVLLKYAVGRTPPSPDYVEQHIYAFRPIVGGEGNFPSTTTTVVVAMATILVARIPRYRTLVVAATAVIAASLPLVNAHWLSDVIGGAFLGMVIGKVLLDRTAG